MSISLVSETMAAAFNFCIMFEQLNPIAGTIFYKLNNKRETELKLEKTGEPDEENLI